MRWFIKPITRIINKKKEGATERQNHLATPLSSWLLMQWFHKNYGNPINGHSFVFAVWQFSFLLWNSFADYKNIVLHVKRYYNHKFLWVLIKFTTGV